jgi:DNA invertase Pin-like site-specific DNA recombinase
VGELLGYMRVSTSGQRFDLQRDALLAAGVAERYLYQDTASGMKQARPGLLACLKALHAGDTLVVWRLDRLARSLLHLMEVAADLDQQRIALRVLEGRLPTWIRPPVKASCCLACSELLRNLSAP